MLLDWSQNGVFNVRAWGWNLFSVQCRCLLFVAAQLTRRYTPCTTSHPPQATQSSGEPSAGDGKEYRQARLPVERGPYVVLGCRLDRLLGGILQLGCQG